MNRDKQIEEMAFSDVDILANDINQHCPDLAENYCGDTHCVACLAHALTTKGYRKASEVAREIIADLVKFADDKERQMSFHGHSVWYIDADDVTDFIAELKKKYTEEITEGEG